MMCWGHTMAEMLTMDMETDVEQEQPGTLDGSYWGGSARVRCTLTRPDMEQCKLRAI